MNWRNLDAELIPDETAWGQGWGGKSYTHQELDEIRSNVTGRPARRLPTPLNRKG